MEIRLSSGQAIRIFVKRFRSDFQPRQKKIPDPVFFLKIIPQWFDTKDKGMNSVFFHRKLKTVKTKEVKSLKKNRQHILLLS